MQITPEHNSLNTRVTLKLATAFRYLMYVQTWHILTSESYSCIAKRNSPVMVIVTHNTLASAVPD